MGLGVTVGLLADLLKHDEEGAGWIKKHFSEINQLLSANGLQEHSEPEECEVWSADGCGYFGLHALREVAGMLWMEEPIPRDVMLAGQDMSYAGELLEAAFMLRVEEAQRGWFSRLIRKKQDHPPLPFLHLVVHSDAEGYYVPVDFPVPLLPDNAHKEIATMGALGSVQQLSKEVTLLKNHLEIPDDLTSQSEDLVELLRLEKSKNDGSLWEAQPIAAYMALMLKEACDASMKTGAAISFG